MCLCVCVWGGDWGTDCYDFLVQALYEAAPLRVAEETGWQSAVHCRESVWGKWGQVSFRHPLSHIVLVALRGSSRRWKRSLPRV